MPTADATDVETDMHVALKFAVPVVPDTVTGEHHAHRSERRRQHGDRGGRRR